MPSIPLQINCPAYALPILRIEHGQTIYPVEQSKTKIELAGEVTSDTPLRLRWGHEDGAPIMRWNSWPQAMQWDSKIAFSGHFDAAHIMKHGDYDLMIFEAIGNLLPIGFQRLPPLGRFAQGAYWRDDTDIEDVDDYWYSFILLLDDPLVDFAHQAFQHGAPVDVFGSLTSQDSGFHDLVGMPFLLDSVTLYRG